MSVMNKWSIPSGNNCHTANTGCVFLEFEAENRPYCSIINKKLVYSGNNVVKILSCYRVTE